MQKKLIAVAVAGLAASGAFAQSNVEIYGLVDLSVVSMTGSYSGRVEGTAFATSVGLVNAGAGQFGNSEGFYNGVGKSQHSWNGLATGGLAPQGYNNPAVAGTPFGAANTNPSAAQEYGSRAELFNGAKEVSRIGFRGTEDLGGGLKAGFVIESSIAADGSLSALNTAGTYNNGSNGTPTANIIGDREATISLTSSNWGRIKMGRQSVANTDLIGYFDPFLGKGPGGIEQLLINPLTTTTANNSIRFDTKLMDVNLTYQYAMAENSDRLNNTTGPGSITGLAAYYAAGPLKVTAGHAVVRDYANGVGQTVGGAVTTAINAATSLNAASIVNIFGAGATATTVGNQITATYMGRSLWMNHIGARYDFGPVELFGQYLTVSSNKTATDDATVGGSILNNGTAGTNVLNTGNSAAYRTFINTGNLVWIGQGGPMINASTFALGFSTNNYFGAHKLLGSWVGTNDKRTWNQDARSLALGYEYSLSKRTTLQLRGAKVYNTNGAPFGVVGGGGQAVALALTNPAASGTANQRTTAYLAGIKHTF